MVDGEPGGDQDQDREHRQPAHPPALEPAEYPVSIRSAERDGRLELIFRGGRICLVEFCYERIRIDAQRDGDGTDVTACVGVAARS